eukprot:CAMPEP_0177571350 /NCGR_PEP_ID=MMETSP0369-20130122/77382_1 /TAXON_ID=447022 ORGANISM="Scrippsiella hangoei-like, Strain SHHI-4" /NCGR_SAMPLE_ID=MMETSP0369 /ASSEMBLY_ACC=CAM_ASM_000364 /LENGTH=80 /DNA_ID=CAMNT_0019059259 /DNA_START=190 /DNA_END=433 /DNA_ORIENTATION=+
MVADDAEKINEENAKKSRRRDAVLAVREGTELAARVRSRSATTSAGRLAQRASKKEKLQVEMVEVKKHQDKETGGGRSMC